MALEISNIIHAIGLVQGGVPPALLGGTGFQATIVRSAAGVYQLTTELSVDYGEAMALASVPAPFVVNARVISDGVIEVVTELGGLGVDPPQLQVVVLRYRSGEIIAPPIPPYTPGALGSFNVRTPANGGDDITGNGSAALPFATPARALAALGGRPGVIHMGSGTYTRPLLADLAGPIVFVGDGGGDAGDDGLIEVIAPQAAGGGTAAGLVVGAGFTVANEGDAIEMLDGAAAGLRRTIVAVENADTELRPARNFSPAPAPGDSFRIVRPAVIWDGFINTETWAQNIGAPTWHFELTSTGLPGAAGLLEACYLCNIAIDGAPSTVWNIQGVLLCCYGVDLSANISNVRVAGGLLAMGTDGLSGRADQLAALLGFASAELFAGYTLTRRATDTSHLRLSAGGLFGYVQGRSAGMSLSRSCVVRLLGGETGRIALFSSQCVLLASATPRMRVTATAGLAAVSGSVGANLDISTAVSLVSAAGDCLRLSEGSIARISGTATAASATGNAANASQGGRVFINGSPVGNWVGGSADFRVSATETATNAGFPAVDATLFAAVGNGSIITRIG